MARKTEIDPAEAARRRRAVYTGLKPFMDEDQVMEALLVWEDRFADGPVYALHGFVSAICAQDALKSRHGEVYRSLMRALTVDEHHLAPDPKSLLRDYRAKRSPTPAPETPGASEDCAPVQIFLAMSERLLGQLEANDPERAFKIRVDVMDRLNELRLPTVHAQTINRWLMQQGQEIPCGLGATVLQELLHRLYVRACELFGPVAADRALASATREAQALPAARQFSPRRLL